MSTSPENLGTNNSAISPGFNVAPGSTMQDPMANFDMLKTWAPKAMSALRQSNIKTQMVNPPIETQPHSSGFAKGIISGLLG